MSTGSKSDKEKFPPSLYENLTSLEIDVTRTFQNFTDIENITSTWFQLMVILNESPKVRLFFANETFNTKEEKWYITPTDFTKDFLSGGILIYEVKEVGTGKVSTLAFTDKKICYLPDNDPAGEVMHFSYDSKEEINIDKIDTGIGEVIKQVLDGDNYEIVALVRWAGCGMKIPQDIEIELKPDIVWPVLTTQTKMDDDKELTVTIENKANEIAWSEAETVQTGHAEKKTEDGLKEVSEDVTNTITKKGFLRMTKKSWQGMTMGDVTIPGKVVHNTTKLQLPYTCASFDILTKIHFDDEDQQELVIFTS